MKKTINIVLFLSYLILTMACAKNPPEDESIKQNSLSQIPSIVKALEALANVGKNKVDKDEEK